MEKPKSASTKRGGRDVENDLRQLRDELGAARSDLRDVRDAMWAMIEASDLGPDELAVCLVLVASIVKAWPGVYLPHVEELARLSRTEVATVEGTLLTLSALGILHSPGSGG